MTSPRPDFLKQHTPDQRAINLSGLRRLMRVLHGLPDDPQDLASERQALLACLCRRAQAEARGAAQVAAVLEVRGRAAEAKEVRRWGGCGPRGRLELHELARSAAKAGAHVRPRALRWALSRI
jgi:hypothetical protein